MTPTTRAQIQIHVCVFLWGFTAILGKLITLSALRLVWWRMLLVSAALLLWPGVWRGLRAMPPGLAAAYAGIGSLVALHWIAFYGAIKLSNASVAASCMALAPLCLALTEPYLVGRSFDPRELVLGVGVVAGVALVVGGVPKAMHVGIAAGVVSALLIAIGGALNKRLIDRGEPLAVTFIEMAAGLLVVSVLLAVAREGSMWSPFQWPSRHDLVLLTILALGCTLVPFALSLVALRHLTAFASQLAVNLEPVYAIAIAAILLGEQREIDAMFYIGVIVILAAVFSQPLIVRRGSRDVSVLPTVSM